MLRRSPEFILGKQVLSVEETPESRKHSNRAYWFGMGTLTGIGVETIAVAAQNYALAGVIAVPTLICAIGWAVSGIKAHNAEKVTVIDLK